MAEPADERLLIADAQLFQRSPPYGIARLERSV